MHPEDLIAQALPNIEIDAKTPLVELGHVDFLRNNYMLINGSRSAVENVVDQGTPIFNIERKIVGVVTEPIAQVTRPSYVVCYASEEELKKYAPEKGSVVYFCEEHSKFAFTRHLRQQKGTDASNVNDEEPDSDEMEFSADSAEEAQGFKKRHKKRPAKNEGRGNRGKRQPQPRADGGLKYSEDDEPYHVLRRPTPSVSGQSDGSRTQYDSQDRGGAQRPGSGWCQGKECTRQGSWLGQQARVSCRRPFSGRCACRACCVSAADAFWGCRRAAECSELAPVYDGHGAAGDAAAAAAAAWLRAGSACLWATTATCIWAASTTAYIWTAATTAAAGRKLGTESCLWIWAAAEPAGRKRRAGRSKSPLEELACGLDKSTMADVWDTSLKNQRGRLGSNVWEQVEFEACGIVIVSVES